MKKIRLFFLSVALLIGVFAFQGQAFAIDIDTAKAQGLVGERPDGLLGSVTTPSADITALIDDVNARRMAIFKRVANEKGQTLDVVQQISGQEFIARTAKGQYVMSSSGKWSKK